MDSHLKVTKKENIGTKQQHVGGYRSYHRTTQSDP